ncbi:MAG: DnaD domain protein [Oscillospiraceae bacterium]|nr:DnaD domain protein [Oscillospiraceae bacterium]
MAEYLLEQVVSLSGQTVDRLLTAGEGDAALLYLALLRRDGPESARKALRWNRGRFQAAWASLARMGLIAGAAPEEQVPVLEPAGPPDYSREDLIRAMGEEGTFSGLYQLTERRLGKKLSDADLRALYEIYDYLALPAEVILLLMTRCTEETQEKYGPGRLPRMSTIKKTAYAWKRMGIDTVEAAEDYLKTQSGLRERERELLPLLDITGRPPVAKEREYMDAWIEMGFPNDVIRLAYERTVMKKQSLNWPYMNSILKSWHSKGLHTAADVAAKDSGRRGSRPAAPAGTSQQAQDRLRQDMDWLEQFAKENQTH